MAMAMAIAGSATPAPSSVAFKHSVSLLLPPPAARPSLTMRPLLVQPLASRICELTGKRRNNGYKVSFSHHRTKKLQQVNLQYKRLWWEAGKRFVKIRLSTKALKTVDMKGLDAVAKEAGIDLNDY